MADPENNEGAARGPVEMDGAMRTGEGADDEPEMTIGDKVDAEGNDSETGGQGTLRVEEAAALLGADENEPEQGDAPATPG